MAGVEAVIWDFGGVFTTSPFDAFERYEQERGLPADIIRRINSIDPDRNAWARLERSELNAEAFDAAFAAEAMALGHAIPGRDVLALLSGDLRPAVVAAFKVCAARFKVGCITNNAPSGKGAGMASDDGKAAGIAEVFGLFDHVIESSKVGLRKPDPRIYAMMCEALGVSPSVSVYLDDLGINLKPARAMGMTTIKVTSEAQLLADLSRAVGLAFHQAPGA
ncbi:MAG: HAD-IA family hydrolase [Alphaproteobacteria bacterium]|nr:HAD-IA family hydrolase [Alphaproteobacteria bacterium]